MRSCHRTWRRASKLRKQHALGTRLRSHFAFAPITRSSTSDELFFPSRSSSRLGPLTVFAGHSNSCSLRCLTAFGYKRPSWTSSLTFHSATSTPPSLHRPAPSRPHSLRLRTYQPNSNIFKQTYLACTIYNSLYKLSSLYLT